MDYPVTKNGKLLDELLQVLNSHHKESGVVEALEDLKAAKINYQQRSTDHMLQALVLAVHDLMVHPPSRELSGELRSVIQSYYDETLGAGSRLAELARQYEASGGRLLSREEILQEVDERRGTSR
ncbi:hypothetical protein SBA4_3070015 [Candidatus Sulfopaludibacter sp. SbA4]|nr:hypothetical protein SBA4_3070015 [Candidatus Sulfopaludibacter sp. SbA4]